MTDNSLLRLAFPGFERKEITAAFDERGAFRRCRRVVVTEKRLRGGHDTGKAIREAGGKQAGRAPCVLPTGLCSRALDHFRRPPFLAGLLVLYGITSGSMLPEIASSEAPLLKFGLYSVDENGRPHTPLDQLGLAVRFMGELAVFTSPLLLLGYFAALAWKAVRRSLNFFDFIFPVTVAAFLLVPFNGDNRYGPRYHFEAFPFLVLTTVSALVPLLQNRARPRWAASAVCLVFAARRGASRLRWSWAGFSGGSSMSAWIDRDVIYALDLRRRLGDLRKLFPHRRFYVNERDPGSPTGTLSRYGKWSSPHARRLRDPRSAVAGPALLFAIFPAALGHDWTGVDAQDDRGYVNAPSRPALVRRDRCTRYLWSPWPLAAQPNPGRSPS
jgi:hypothetical protein